jgi:translation initiation factor 6
VAIYTFVLFGSASIGVYSLATEKIVIIPPQIPRHKAERVGKWLKTDMVQTMIGKSVLIGALACANSNGMLLPHFVREEEIKTLQNSCGKNFNLTIMETRRTAYGNMVLTNDKGAIVDPRLKAKDIKIISDTLDVEVVPGEIAGLPYVGSLATATNNGILAHPLIKEEEKKLIEEVMKTPVDVGTINCGVPYVGTGLIANTKAAVAGFLTTGPEMFIIGQVLDVVKKDE